MKLRVDKIREMLAFIQSKNSCLPVLYQKNLTLKYTKQ